MLAQVLDRWTPTLRDVAAQCGLSYHAVRAYRARQRTPAPAILRRMAAELEKHATQCKAGAAKLRMAAKRAEA